MNSRHLLLAALFLTPAPIAAQVGAPLTQEQVECEARQLRRLQSRMVAQQFESTIFLWRSSPADGQFQGVVVSNGISRVQATQQYQRFERQMAFDLLLRPAGDFLDPRRPLLPQAALARRDGATNLDDRRIPFRLDLSFDLAQEVPNPFDPSQPIRIDAGGSEGRAASDRAGRGIQGNEIPIACQGNLTDFDHRVFTVLARTLRATYCYAEPVSCGLNNLAFRAILYRSQEPLTYDVEFYEYRQTADDDGTVRYGEAQITLRFRFLVSSTGALMGGDVRILPLCQPGQSVGCSFFGNPTLALFVLPPIRAGVERQDASAFDRGARLFVDFFGSGNEILSANVNWADLLRGTAWGAP